MVKNKMEVDAVDIAYTFGLEYRFNAQTILISFLRESKESWKMSKKASHGSSPAHNEANKKQLACLKSVTKCLKRHNINPANLLPGWQINDKISTLEKEISEFNRKSGDKTTQKRKASEPETSKNSKIQETKRSCYTGQDNRRNIFQSELPASHSVIYGGPGSGLLPESMIPLGARAGGVSSSRGDALSTSLYLGVHSGVLVDAGGQVLSHGTQPCSWHGDAALIEKYASQPSVGLASLYRAQASMERFAGLPNVSPAGVGSRSSGSDLYQFADTVVNREFFPSGGPPGVGAIPTAVSGHHLSYLYQV